MLGETWVSHYGHHKVESTRGSVVEGREDESIVNGCEDIWGPTDVYGIRTLTGDSKPLIMGHVLTGMNPDDPEHAEKKPVPIAWTKSYTGDSGKTARVFSTTMGSSQDLESEGYRRLLINGIYWMLKMEERIPERAKVDIVGEYKPG